MNNIIRNIHIYCLTAFIFLISCNGNSTDGLPIVTTNDLTKVTQTSATCGVTIISDGGSIINDRGVCWSTNADPTIKNNKTLDGSGTGTYTSSIDNLSPATTFYVRAYATNTNGTSYGAVLQLTTPPDAGSSNLVLNPDLSYGTVTDIDGNIYHTITIGNQTWMAENLCVTKFRNGDVIPTETNNPTWNTLSSPAQCTYNNSSETNSILKFGRFYNFYAATDTRKIAPLGWHVATDTEWIVLLNYIVAHLGSSASAAQALSCKTDWLESIIPSAVGYFDLNSFTSFNNSSGMSALPSGIRDEYGYYDFVTKYCAWWTTTEKDKNLAVFRSLNNYDNTIGKNYYKKSFGLSVRCVKD